MDSRFDIIEVNTSVSNPEFPTRIRIVDFDGNFEHSGDYTAPKFTFSVKVEVEYNKIVNDKEENLVKVRFWTEEDSSVFSFEDDELDEESVEDWFWEGLSEDLSHHGLEGLEGLDFYSEEVPACEEDEMGWSLESAIADALQRHIPDSWSNFEYECSDLYKTGRSITVPQDWSKTEEITCGNTRTVWSITDYELEVGYDDEGKGVVNAIFYVQGKFFVGGDLLFEVTFETLPLYLLQPCGGLNAAAHELIEESSLCWLLEQNKLYDLSENFNSFRTFVEMMLEYDDCDSISVESIIAENVYDGFIVHSEVVNDMDDIEVEFQSSFVQWIEKYNNMSDAQRRAIAYGE